MMHTVKKKKIKILTKVKMPLKNICVIKYYKVQFHGLYLLFMKGKCFQLRQVNQTTLWTWITYVNAQGRDFWKQIPAIGLVRAASGTGNVLRTIGSVCYWGDERRRSSESLRPSAKLGAKPRGTCQPQESSDVHWPWNWQMASKAAAAACMRTDRPAALRDHRHTCAHWIRAVMLASCHNL